MDFFYFVENLSAYILPSITDVRWLESCNTYLFFEIGTVIITAIAHLAIFQRLSGTATTAHMDFSTAVPMHTGVVSVCSISGAFNNRVFSDFSGNSGSVFSEFLGNLAKRFSVEKTIFHFHSFLVCDIIRHGIDLL